MTPERTTFQQQLAFGSVGESLIANWLRKKGHSILPVYEIEMDKGKGPRLFAPEEKLIAPDMMAFQADGGMCWIEAKHKTVFSWHRISKRWVTGIDLNHYENYISIADRYPYEIYLLFLHRSAKPDARDAAWCQGESPTGLFAGKVSELRKNENHRHGNHGRHGMVYWARESLRKLATLKELEDVQIQGLPDLPSLS